MGKLSIDVEIKKIEYLKKTVEMCCEIIKAHPYVCITIRVIEN